MKLPISQHCSDIGPINSKLQSSTSHSKYLTGKIFRIILCLVNCLFFCPFFALSRPGKILHLLAFNLGVSITCFILIARESLCKKICNLVSREWMNASELFAKFLMELITLIKWKIVAQWHRPNEVQVYWAQDWEPGKWETPDCQTCNIRVHHQILMLAVSSSCSHLSFIKFVSNKNLKINWWTSSILDFARSLPVLLWYKMVPALKLSNLRQIHHFHMKTSPCWWPGWIFV